MFEGLNPLNGKEVFSLRTQLNSPVFKDWRITGPIQSWQHVLCLSIPPEEEDFLDQKPWSVLVATVTEAWN